jgi:hypothetical protein
MVNNGVDLGQIGQGRGEPVVVTGMRGGNGSFKTISFVSVAN